MTRPDQRAVARANHVLAQLQPEAIGALVERLIDRLDAAEPDPDTEDGDPGEPDNEDCCEAEDDNLGRLFFYSGDLGAGDLVDAEPDPEGLGTLPTSHLEQAVGGLC